MQSARNLGEDLCSSKTMSPTIKQQLHSNNVNVLEFRSQSNQELSGVENSCSLRIPMQAGIWYFIFIIHLDHFVYNSTLSDGKHEKHMTSKCESFL